MTPPRGTLLLVDDDDAIRDTAREVLEEEGWAVVEARDGREALRLFERSAQAYCAILLDIMMPVMSGHAFLEALQRLSHLPRVPVIVWTAGRDQSFGPPSPARVLRKPFDVHVLLDAVAEACAA